MTGKWRPVVAVSLSLVLLLLSVTAELAHQHGNWPPGNVGVAAFQPDDAVQFQQTHGYNCVACLYSLANIAVNFSDETVSAPQTFCLTITATTHFNLLYCATHSNLRAPPAVLA